MEIASIFFVLFVCLFATCVVVAWGEEMSQKDFNEYNPDKFDTTSHR